MITCVGEEPTVVPSTTPTAITMIQMSLKRFAFMLLPQPRIPDVANAADKGAVIVEEKPAANRPIPNIYLAAGPRSGSNWIAMSLPFAGITYVPWKAAAAAMIIAMEITPPRPMETKESMRADLTSSGVFQFLAAEDACRKML